MMAHDTEWLVYFNWNDDLNRQGWNFNANRPDEIKFNEGNQVLLRYFSSFFPARGSFCE